MKIQELEEVIRIELDEKSITYKKSNWSSKEPYYVDGEMVKIPEWKLDLVEKQGVDINEL